MLVLFLFIVFVIISYVVVYCFSCCLLLIFLLFIISSLVVDEKVLLTGLTPNTTYNLIVRAMNEVGLGRPAKKSVTTDPARMAFIYLKI